MRLRDLGLALGTLDPGRNDAITDVDGLRVGHTTLIEGDGPLVVGQGPVRTGVTVVIPHPAIGEHPVFAGAHRLNGNGELTGLEWVRESGTLTTPVGLTNTHSVGIVRDALVAYEVGERAVGDVYWSLPVVGETWDGLLNDINGFHVRAEHVHDALREASPGPIAEGNVGGGTGMVCHGFKGGIGSASRVLPAEAGGFTVGVLVQANHGRRSRLRIEGIPVGEILDGSVVPEPDEPPAVPGAGSIIGLVATDAPLLPHQCERLAQRAGLGVARLGGAGEHSSGDLFLAFSTANADRLESYKADGDRDPVVVAMLPDAAVTDLYYAVIEATEAAIVSAMLAARTMAGRDDLTVHALEAERLLEVLVEHRGDRG